MGPHEKEAVIEHLGDGFAFRLPEQHRAVLINDRRYVSLSIPGEGGTYPVTEIIEDDAEIRIVVEREKIMGHATGMGEVMKAVTGYPFPTIDHELRRLEAAYVAAGGENPPTRPHAWAQGASWDDHTRWLRDEIRRLRERPA